MATENTETKAESDEETGSPSEPNEHDYAHAAAGICTSPEASTSSPAPLATDYGVSALEGFATPGEQSAPEQQRAVSVELPEPAVGAEVDCPGGNFDESSSSLLPQTGGESVKTEGSGPDAVSRPRASRYGRRRTTRPEDRNCACCRLEFERQGRSFNRRAVYTFTTPETVHWAFPDAKVNEKSFLCETCAQVIRSKCKRKQSGKRPLWLKPPAVKQSEAKDKTKKGRRMGKKSKAALLVSKSCYKAAFKMLWSAKGARRPMMEFWSKQLKEEMKALTRQTDNPFHQKVTSRKPLSSFPWRRCLNWAQDKAPLVTTCLSALFPDTGALSKSSHQLSEEQAQVLLERRAVVALSIPLFTRNIWKNNFLQAALGAELRLQGCSGSALDALNTMGLCQNKDTVRLLLQRLRNGKKTNGQRLKINQDQMKEQMTDEEEEEGEEEEDEMEIEEDVEEEEMQDTVHEEEEEDQAVEEKTGMENKRKKTKKQRRERGKQEEGEEDEEQKRRRRVVVVRLGLLKGHSEVGRSDLSAP